MEATRQLMSAEELQEIRRAIVRARQRIGAWEIRSGRWLEELVEAHLRAREERRREVAAPQVDESERVARSEARIRRAGALLGLSGAGAGAAWTAAVVAAAQTNGLAGIVTVPLAGAVVGGDLILRTLVQLGLVSDLAELYGLEFSSDHVADVMRLHALALDVIEHADEEDLGRGLVEKVAMMDSHELGKAVGTTLATETVLRNVLPYVGVVTSALASVRFTYRLGRTVRSYLTYRRGLMGVFDEVERRAPECVVPLARGLWSIFTADGRLTRSEASLLADLVRQQPERQRQEMLEGFEAENLDWIDGLTACESSELRDLALHALEVATAVDAVVEPSEIAVLNRAAEALGRTCRPEDIEGMAKQIQRTGTWNGAPT